MARSYGSYFRQRDLDKPYRGAEIVLGFLGDMMAAKNQQSLGYEKLAVDREKTQATKEYREQTLASKTLAVDPSKDYFKFNPETGGYDKLEGVGGGGADFAKIYGDEFFNTYLKGQVAYEDADNDGVPDRTYVGPKATLWRDYQTALNEGKEGWEFKHPDLVEDQYRNYKGDDKAKQKEILDFFNDQYDYERKFKQYKSFEKVTDDREARGLLETYAKSYQPKKLTVQDKTSIELYINRREDLIAALDKRKERRTYKLPETSYITSSGEISGGLEFTGKTEDIIPLTPAEEVKYREEVTRIETWLTDTWEIQYSQFDYVAPEDVGSWVK